MALAILTIQAVSLLLLVCDSIGQQGTSIFWDELFSNDQCGAQFRGHRLRRLRVSIVLTIHVFTTYIRFCLCTPGVRFILSGAVYFNNSVIIITDIGTETTWTSPLVCLTDFRPCCRGRYAADQPVVGEWYYPNGSMVPGRNGFGQIYAFFRARGENDGTVNLFRRNNGITSPFGRYCCEIPDISNIFRTLCVNLGKLSASIC